ncbi:50S ribosomal protein L25/general stress protein Ctc [Ravibacter arvi]|uniref:Large ribosomal subunit protein bL25 n=1 Tax=Ravibacter arvi TaxID=2051041 RepID=A0ABP8LT85_9BACT
MKKVEIVGYKRADLGKTAAQRLRAEGYVPSVLYGGESQLHFYAPAILFRPLLFTPDVYEVTLNIEGEIRYGILQDTQYHPVNDALIHADFLEVVEGKAVTVDVPIKLTGTSEGVIKGGKLNQKLRKLRVKGLSNEIPDYIELDVTSLGLGKSLKVEAIKAGGFEVLSSRNIPVVSIDIPRALRGTLRAE